MDERDEVESAAGEVRPREAEAKEEPAFDAHGGIAPMPRDRRHRQRRTEAE